MTRRYAIPTFYLLAVFLCGAAVGGFGFRLYELKGVRAAVSGRPSPEEWKRRHVAELRSRLHLNDAQVGQLSAILDDTRVKIHAVIAKNQPEMDAIQADQYARVKAILNPDQIAEYEKFHAERQRRRGAERGKF